MGVQLSPARGALHAALQVTNGLPIADWGVNCDNPHTIALAKNCPLLTCVT
jgi:hypothetical protein